MQTHHDMISITKSQAWDNGKPRHRNQRQIKADIVEDQMIAQEIENYEEELTDN